jgi:hypothetical protein
VRSLAAALACAAAAAAAAGGARADGMQEEARGFVAARAAAALPAGNAREGLPMGDLVSGALPVGLEVGARGGGTALGFAVEWGPALAAGCPAGAACSGALARAGIELLHRFAPAGRASAWVGGGLGWERTRVSRAGQGTRVDSLELLNLQVGYDWAVSPRAAVGPFLLATFAQGMQQDGEDVQRKSPHLWLQLGVRGELGL